MGCAHSGGRARLGVGSQGTGRPVSPSGPPPGPPLAALLPSQPGRPSPKAISPGARQGGPLSAQAPLLCAAEAQRCEGPGARQSPRQTRSSTWQARASPTPTGAPSSRHLSGCPCPPSRPWGLLPRAPLCRQPQLTGHRTGPGGVVGGHAGWSVANVLWGRPSDSLSSRRRVESKMGCPLGAIWRREGEAQRRRRCV